MTRIQRPKGTDDLLPEQVPVVDFLFDTCRDVLRRHGYGEIRTPLFEETALFVRSLGEVTDVVEKEMFSVRRGETDVTFRPEGTAPVVRAYLQHSLDKVRAFQKFFYMGPMFRYERPQAGRQRQFLQIGIEAIGSHSPLLDAEAVLVAHKCFAALGLTNYRVHLNSIGDRADRDRFRDVLKTYFAPLLAERCSDCHARFERNVFRMLDCKVQGCQPTNRNAPKFLDHLSDASRARFEQTVALLARLDVPHVVDPAIVRGFDYYTHLVFEIRCPDLGARDTICGGGRYDGLVAEMGGTPQGAIGFAIGVTPTLLALERQGSARVQPAAPHLDVFVAPVTDDEREHAFLLTERIRAAGVQCDTDYEARSLKSIFKGVEKRGVRLVVIVGPDERAAGVVKVKDLAAREEFPLTDDASLGAALAARLRA